MRTFTIKSKNSKSIKIFLNFSILIFWIFIWEVLFKAIGQEILIVSPKDVFFNVFVLSGKISFWKTIFFSTSRIILGFTLAVALGVFLASLSAKFKAFLWFIKPLFTVIKSTPVASFVVLTLVFIKSAYLPIFISFLMVLPIVWNNVLEGIRKVDTKLIDLGKVFKFSKFTYLFKIYVPSVFPYFSSAIATGLGFAWKSGIAAEIIANTKLSIGSEIYDSKIYLDTLNLFSWTLVVVIMSLLLEKIISALFCRMTKKYGFNKNLQ